MLIRPHCKTLYRGLLVVLFLAVGIKAAFPKHVGDLPEDLQRYFEPEEIESMDSIFSNRADQSFLTSHGAYQHSATTSSVDPNPMQGDYLVHSSSGLPNPPSEGTSSVQTFLSDRHESFFRLERDICVLEIGPFPTKLFLRESSIHYDVLPLFHLGLENRIARFKNSKSYVYRMSVGDLKSQLVSWVNQRVKDYEMVMIYEAFNNKIPQYYQVGFPLALPWWTTSSTRSLLSDFLGQVHGNIGQLPFLPELPVELKLRKNLRRNWHEVAESFEFGETGSPTFYFKSYALVDGRSLWGFSLTNGPETFRLIDMDAVYKKVYGLAS